jgi:outer membrane protein assembly factor BamD (BamD/ComL family)
MDTPLPSVPRAKRAGRWLRRLAALLLLGGSVAGCQTIDELNPPKEKPSVADKELIVTNLDNLTKPVASTLPPPAAKTDHSFFEWPNWEWEDFDLFGIFPKPAPDTPPPDAFVVQSGNLTPVKTPAQTKLEARMAEAREAFRAKDYKKAEAIFHRVADNEKNPPKMVQEAKFYEAECLYFQDDWPKAGDTYADLMNKFPRNEYREVALQKMFDIARYWLIDSVEEAKEYEQKDQGQRWFVMPRFVSFEPRKPLLDREGRAVQLLEQVRYGDINGPLADQALFMCGNIKFFDGDYKDAAYYYTQISEKHPESKLAQTATKLAIVAKHMSTGGPDYDGRQAAEARILVQRAMENYPELANKERDFLMRQLVNITVQQAAKDFRMAEFWERTGHPGAAVFYYELVIRRYHGTHPYDEDAVKRRDAILAKIEKEQGGVPTTAPGATEPHLSSRAADPAPGPKVLPPDLSVPGR